MMALVPAVNTGFKCLGSECPDNCCTGWTVTIDQPSYLAYKKSIHPDLKDLFASQLQLEKNPTPQQYATIELKSDDKSCSFLDGGLCKIQKQLGEEALSDTCSGYPRMTLQHGDLLQQGLTLSCPDAAQRILLQDELTEFVQAPITARQHQLQIVKDPNPATAELTRAVRFFAMRIMRQSSFAVWERMTLLGFFCEEATALQKKSDFASYASLIARYEEMLDASSLHQMLSHIGSYPQVQLKVFAGILFSKLPKVNTRHQKAVLSDFYESVFGLQASMDPEAFKNHVLEKYATGISHLEHVLTAKPHFMANYLVNQMFNEGFPFNEPCIFDSYLRLISRFGTLRMLLALRCSYSRQLPSPLDLAVLTQVYARNFEHDRSFKDAINQALHQAGFDSMKYIVGIIRD